MNNEHFGSTPEAIHQRQQLLLHEHNVLVVSKEVGGGVQKLHLADVGVLLLQELLDQVTHVLRRVILHVHRLVAANESKYTI